MDLGLALVSKDRKRYGLVGGGSHRSENLALAVGAPPRHLLHDHREQRRERRARLDALRIRTPA